MVQANQNLPTVVLVFVIGRYAGVLFRFLTGRQGVSTLGKDSKFYGKSPLRCYKNSRVKSCSQVVNLPSVQSLMTYTPEERMTGVDSC